MPGTRNSVIGLALLVNVFLIGEESIHAQSLGHLKVGSFSSAKVNADLPDEWHPVTYSQSARHTKYSLVKDENTVVVKAVSEQSASALTRAISIDPAQHQVIQWRWKVNNILRKGDVNKQEADDYPARVYVNFTFDATKVGYLEKIKYKATQLIGGQSIPYRAIVYIWGSNTPAGTMIQNSYSDRVMMFVVQGGADKLQQWVTERRNIYDDYRKAFGSEPPMISSVAIMTDTDNTEESAIAWYGDIVFSSVKAN